MGIFSKKSLGIDIGAASIKIVEVSVSGNKRKLENYVEFKLPPLEKSIKTFHGESLLLISDDVAQILQAILKRAKIKQRKAVFSIPDFSSFFTTFSLPPMTETEIPQAVEFEARHHIPIPLQEVTFDWQVVEKEQVASGVKLKVLLVAVPNTVLKNYQRMADLSQLEIAGMEAEVFGLIRSSFPRGPLEHLPLCMVDIGWQSTTVSIVEKKKLKQSFSFDLSGTGLTDDLASALQVEPEKAEDLKKRFGLDPQREDVSKVLTARIESLALEIDKICKNFFQSEGKRVDNIILSGGTSFLFGLREYLSTRIKKKIFKADPFSSLSFPSVLNNRLKELGPSFPVAVGAAMMGAEN